MSPKLERLLALEFPVVRHAYVERDVMLYALGLGLPRDPLSPEDLAFVFEDGLKVLPTFAAVAAHPGFWLAQLDTGLDASRAVHGEQTLQLHKPFPSRGTVVGRSRIAGVADKGPDKGALVYYEREIRSEAGELLATAGQAVFCRGDGGIGSGGEAHGLNVAIPQRAPVAASRLQTSPRAALIYRLSGDYNPLHADPATAARAGFPRPILHGLATYGAAGLAVLEHACGLDPARLAALHGRFHAPVFPGEALETVIWIDGEEVSFQTRVLDRDVIVLSGLAQRRPAPSAPGETDAA